MPRLQSKPRCPPPAKEVGAEQTKRSDPSRLAASLLSVAVVVLFGVSLSLIAKLTSARASPRTFETFSSPLKKTAPLHGLATWFGEDRNTTGACYYTADTDRNGSGHAAAGAPSSGLSEAAKARPAMAMWKTTGVRTVCVFAFSLHTVDWTAALSDFGSHATTATMTHNAFNGVTTCSTSHGRTWHLLSTPVTQRGCPRQKKVLTCMPALARRFSNGRVRTLQKRVQVRTFCNDQTAPALHMSLAPPFVAVGGAGSGHAVELPTYRQTASSVRAHSASNARCRPLFGVHLFVRCAVAHVQDASAAATLVSFDPKHAQVRCSSVHGSFPSFDNGRRDHARSAAFVFVHVLRPDGHELFLRGVDIGAISKLNGDHPSRTKRLHGCHRAVRRPGSRTHAPMPTNPSSATTLRLICDHSAIDHS